MDLIESIEKEFEDMEYPIRNIMEISPQLSNGSETVFRSDDRDYEAVNIVKELNKHLKDGPKEGFPYKNKDDIIEDLTYALKEEDIIE